MPFDILPSHRIALPPVQFYHARPELAQMALNARQHAYDSMLKGLDSMLNAVDPLTMAKRREAIAESQYMQKYGLPLQQQKAQFEIEELPLQRQLLQRQLNWYKNNPNALWGPPKNPSEALALQKLGVQQGNVDNFNDTLNPEGQPKPTSGGGTTPATARPTPASSAEAFLNQQKDAMDRHRQRVDDMFDSQNLELAPPREALPSMQNAPPGATPTSSVQPPPAPAPAPSATPPTQTTSSPPGAPSYSYDPSAYELLSTGPAFLDIPPAEGARQNEGG
jgi:hypothetical protein